MESKSQSAPAVQAGGPLTGVISAQDLSYQHSIVEAYNSTVHFPKTQKSDFINFMGAPTTQ